MIRWTRIRTGGMSMGLALAVAMCTAVCVSADVTVKQTATTSGLGGLLNVEIKTETMIKDEMQCVNTETEMKGGILGMFAGGEAAKTSTVTRLDKGVVWEITHEKKTYTEMPISAMKEMIEQFGGAGMSGMSGMSEDEESMADDEDIEMSPPKFSVEKTGKKEKIAGYNCEQSILTMEMEGTNTETGEKFTIFLTMDMMLAKDVPGYEEYQAFSVKYAEAVGMGDGLDPASIESMMMGMRQYGVDPETLAEEAKKLKGFPMRTVMKMTGDGPQFDAMKSSGADSSLAAAKEEMNKAMGMLGGLFGKKKKKEEPKEEPVAASDGALFTVTTEVTKISTKSIKSDRFEVPKKYKKKKSPFDYSDE